MRSFRYKPRRPHVAPEAPDPETPQSSDWRLYAAMLRIAFTAIIVVATYAVMVSRGATRGIAGIVILALAVVFAAVPDLRDLARRGWYWYWPSYWWWDPMDDGFDGDDS